MQKYIILASLIFAISFAQKFQDLKAPQICQCDQWRYLQPQPITVTGAASTQVPQKRFQIVASYSNLALQAEDALAQNNEVMNKAKEDLQKHKNGDRLEIQTTGFSIYPSYQYNYNPKTGESNQVFEGFRVTNSILVKTKGDCPKMAGCVIDILVQSGLTSIDQIQFFPSEESVKQAKEELYELAIQDAQQKADKLLINLQLQRNGVKSVQLLENNYQPPVFYGRAQLAESVASSNTQLNSGDANVTVSVQVQYNIKQKS